MIYTELFSHSLGPPSAPLLDCHTLWNCITKRWTQEQPIKKKKKITGEYSNSNGIFGKLVYIGSLINQINYFVCLFFRLCSCRWVLHCAFFKFLSFLSIIIGNFKRFSFFQDPRLSLDHTNLVVKNLTREDAGIYTCEVSHL